MTYVYVDRTYITSLETAIEELGMNAAMIFESPFLLFSAIGLLVVAFLCANYGKKKGYAYWLCFFGCLLGQLPGIITVLLLPDITALEDQHSASIRYRDGEIESLKKRIDQLEKQLNEKE